MKKHATISVHNEIKKLYNIVFLGLSANIRKCNSLGVLMCKSLGLLESLIGKSSEKLKYINREHFDRHIPSAFLDTPNK